MNSTTLNADMLLTGMIDDFAVFRRTDFVPEKIHPMIRSFYEQTVNYCLQMRSHWHVGFRFIAKIYKFLSSRLGQLNFPNAAEEQEDLIDHFLPIDGPQNGQANVRGCVRTYRNSGIRMYIAIFSTHIREDQTYMDIAFPLPGGNMTFVRRIEALALPTGPQGILLTTQASSCGSSDEGVYFVNRFLRLRLPIHETLRIWPANNDEACTSDDKLLACHEVQLCGLKCLTVDYVIYPKEF